MNTWKPIFAALVIFATGVVTGALTVFLASPQKTSAASGPPPSGFRGARTVLADRMQRELYLTTEQRARIEKILRESHERTRQLWESIAPQAQAEQKRVREEIKAILNTEQQARFDESFKMRRTGRFGSERPRDEAKKPEDRKSGRMSRDLPHGAENRRDRTHPSPP